jgi:1-acyl-sn-glycerol-3-phosphate acyltransferase
MGVFSQSLDSVLELPDNYDEIFEFLDEHYSHHKDPWGLDHKVIKSGLKMVWLLYKHYFRVRLLGAEKVQDRPYMVVANHTGQIALDGALLYCAFLTQIHPPKVLRAMVERFIPTLPFFGNFVAEYGAVLGDRQNCKNLIENGETLMVFPEGARGIAKNTQNYYQVQTFSKGFYRMALIHHTPIIPCAIIGCEEMYPYIYHLRGLAKRLGLPALPLSPSLLLGPIGALPLPSPVDIILGDPIELPQELEFDSPDKDIESQVAFIQETIQGLIRTGLKNRRPFKELIGLSDQREV